MARIKGAGIRGEGHRKRSGISETKVSHRDPPGKDRTGQNFTYPIGEKKSTHGSEIKKRGTRARKQGRGEQSCFPGEFYGGRKGGKRERHMTVMGNESLEE